MNFVTTLINMAPYVSVFGAIIPVIFWWYQKRPSIKANVIVKNNSLKLRLRNHKDSVVEVDHVRVVKKKAFWCEPEFNDNNYGYLVHSSNADIFPLQGDELNIAIATNDSVEEFEIDFSNMAGLYDDFIPYDYSVSPLQIKYLRKPVKMPICHIGIYLKSGKIVCVPIPEEFYNYYRKNEGDSFDTDFDIIMGRGDVTLTFNSTAAQIEHLKMLREAYFVVRRNYHLLLH